MTEKNEYNCVRITKLKLIENLDGHLDNILHQIIHRTGNIQKLIILDPERLTDNDTVCYIQPVDQNQIKTLVYLLHDWNFHGKFLNVTPSSYKIKIFSTIHHPHPTPCLSCSTYNHELEKREYKLLKKYYDKIINDSKKRKKAIQIENERQKRGYLRPKEEHHLSTTNESNISENDNDSDPITTTINKANENSSINNVTEPLAESEDDNLSNVTNQELVYFCLFQKHYKTLVAHSLSNFPLSLIDQSLYLVYFPIKGVSFTFVYY